MNGRRSIRWPFVRRQALDLVAAERDFLLHRHSRRDDRDLVGASSDALVDFALHGERPVAWPADRRDLARCENTYRTAPPHVQARMAPLLARFRAHVERRCA